jgi:hypothetical protein
MRKFQRTVEDFICGHCGAKVTGNGYTNHCPKCLWSKHVDINPGDRMNICGGLMQPVGLQNNHGNFLLTHRCVVCGFESKCKSAPKDDINALTQLSETLAKKTFF